MNLLVADSGWVFQPLQLHHPYRLASYLSLMQRLLDRWGWALHCLPRPLPPLFHPPVVKRAASPRFRLSQRRLNWSVDHLA